MNKKNLDFLKENLKYLGFGDKLYPELEKNIEQRFPEFMLKLDTEINQQTFSTALHFKRSGNTDMYFFNRYDAALQQTAGGHSQSFYINKGQGITLKEAYNLLEGRAVYKDLTNNEGEKYNAWLQLNFKETDANGNYKLKQFHQNYGYNLEKTLAQYPIRELNNEQQKEMLLRSLQRGNVQVATFEKGGMQKMLFLEANPQFKTITIYNSKGQRMSNKQEQNESKKQNITANVEISNKVSSKKVSKQRHSVN